MKTENEFLKEMLEGKTVVIVTVKHVGKTEVEPMVRIDKVDNGMFSTTEGTYTGLRKGDVDYKSRSITFTRDIGQNIVSRTFTVVNTGSNIDRGGYKPYATSEEGQLWLEAEEASWKWCVE